MRVESCDKSATGLKSLKAAAPETSGISHFRKDIPVTSAIFARNLEKTQPLSRIKNNWVTTGESWWEHTLSTLPLRPSSPGALLGLILERHVAISLSRSRHSYLSDCKRCCSLSWLSYIIPSIVVVSVMFTFSFVLSLPVITLSLSHVCFALPVHNLCSSLKYVFCCKNPASIFLLFHKIPSTFQKAIHFSV